MFITQTPEQCADALMQTLGTDKPFNLNDEFGVAVNTLWNTMVASKCYYVPIVMEAIYSNISDADLQKLYVTALADLKDSGKVKKDLDMDKPEVLHYFDEGAFITRAFLLRGVAYVHTLKPSKDKKSINNKIELVTANKELLAKMKQAGLILDKDGNTIKAESYDKTLKKLDGFKLEKTGATMGVIALTPVKQRGNNFYFQITARQSQISLEAEVPETPSYISSLSSVYTFTDNLMKTFSSKYFKFIKSTNYGSKEHIATFNESNVKKIYKLEDRLLKDASESMEAQDMMHKLKEAACGFALGEQYISCYDVEAPIGSGFMTSFHPSCLESIEEVVEADIDTTMHDINTTVLRDYICSSIKRAKAEDLKTFVPILSITNRDGSAMTPTEYKNALITKIVGITPQGTMTETDMTNKDLWAFVHNYSNIFGDDTTIAAAMQQGKAKEPKYLKNFKQVQLPEDADKARDYLDKLSKSGVLRIDYNNKSKGNVSTCVVSNNMGVIKQVYGAYWVYSITPLKRVQTAIALVNKYPENALRSYLQLNSVIAENTTTTKSFIDMLKDTEQALLQRVQSVSSNVANSTNINLHALAKYGTHTTYTLNPTNIVNVGYSEVPVQTDGEIVSLVDKDLTLLIAKAKASRAKK